MENGTSKPSNGRPTSNDRQPVQLIGQPSTAAQYLQQMYAAQQQHLMLQTAALQHQQHRNTTTQQTGVAVSRASPAVNVSQQTAPQITLASSPQIIQRPQTVSSTTTPASAITQQAVVLGNASSPASQAQMYLRAQMLIFTPAATVGSIQSDVSSSQPPPISTRVHNLAVQGPGGETAAPNPTQQPTLAMKPASLSLHPVTKAAGRGGSHTTDGNKKGETPGTGSHTGRPTISTHAAIIAPACSPQLVPKAKPFLNQMVIQKQPHIQPRPQPLTHQPQVSQGLSSPPITSQAPLVPPSLCVEPNKQKPSPILPPQSRLGAQDGEIRCRLLPPNSAVIIQIPNAKAVVPPLQDNPRKPCDPHRSHWRPTAQIAAAATANHMTNHTANHMTNHTANHMTNHTANRHQTRSQGPHKKVQANRISPPPPPVDMTSGNGSSPLPATATGSTPHNGENKPPQAVVRPQILTHVIEGFVIQEGAQPFPSPRSRAALQVGRSSLMAAKDKGQQQEAEKLPQQDNHATTTPTDSEVEEPSVPELRSDGDPPPKLKCELCGRVDLKFKFKRSKRFCSMACAKRYNVGCTKRVGLFIADPSKLQKPPERTRRSRKASLAPPTTHCMKPVPGSLAPSSPLPQSVSSTLKHTHSQEVSSRGSEHSSYDEPLSPISASSSLSRQHHPDMEITHLHSHINHNFLPSDPTKWNVEDVYEFIRSLPGCQEISEEFRAQEIDGQALLLLKEDHLMSAMNIKLGPALKIFARISMLKDS